MATETYVLSGQTTFQFNHQVRTKDQIEFELDGVPYSPTYTVTGLGNNTTGLTFSIPTVPATGSLVIKTIAVASRVTDFLTATALTPTALDDEFNNLITITADLRTDVDANTASNADHETRLDVLEDDGGAGTPTGKALKLNAGEWNFEGLKSKNIPTPTQAGDILRYGDVDFEAGGLPSQTGHANKLLATDGTVPTWQFVDTANITDFAVTTGKLAGNSVTTPKIAAGAVGTSELANGGVTYAKIQDVTAGRLLGRQSGAGAGSVGEIIVGPGLALSGSVLSVVSGDSADVSMTTAFDVTASYSNIGPGLTIPSTGTYLVLASGQVDLAAANVSCLMRLAVDGSGFSLVVGVHYNAMTMSTVFSLLDLRSFTAGEVVTVQAERLGGTIGDAVIDNTKLVAIRVA